MVNVRPSLLGFLRGALRGTMKAGVGGAEKAWSDGAGAAPEMPNLGKWDEEGRFEAEVLTDKFFMLRIFLLGESERSKPGRVGKVLANRSLPSISPGPETGFVFG